MAAARLGISVVILCPEEGSPASQVAARTIIADYDDQAALKRFSEASDVITYEFENIPIETVDYLEKLKPGSVLPNRKLLQVSQDRITEKTFLNDLGIQTTGWKAVSRIEDIDRDNFIIKTSRFGYDGKGQIKCNGLDDSVRAFLEHYKNLDLILEDIVDFNCEISVIVARDKDGNTEAYGPMLNEHKNHILHRTTVPAGLDELIARQSIDITKDIAQAVELIGVLTVEFFVTKDNRLLVNEIAPRTHNSGHWSIDACGVSQFENHVRAVCGLPLGRSTPHSGALMINLIGDDVTKIDRFFTLDKACIHLYGKTQARAGRKMGHVTILNPDNTIDYDAFLTKETKT